jgi:hypothetical protein
VETRYHFLFIIIDTICYLYPINMWYVYILYL